MQLLYTLLLSLLSFGAAPDLSWQEVSRDNLVTVYRKKDPDDDVMTYRGIATLNASTSKIMTVLKDVKQRPEWTDSVEKAEVVRQSNERDWIEYDRIDAPWPIKDRDMVYRSKIEYEPKNNRIVIQARSVQDPLKPLREDSIRAVVHASNVIVEPLAGGAKTRITAEVRIDPRGDIPDWAVDIFQKRFPKISIKNLLRRVSDPSVNKDLETEWFLNQLSAL